jgi:predicted phage baseplate assembly protein
LVPAPVPQGTQVAAFDPITGDSTFFETDKAVTVINAELKRVLTHSGRELIDNTSINGAIGSFYFAFGNTPTAGSALCLGFQGPTPFPNAPLTLLVNTYEGDLPALNDTSDAQHVDVVPSAEIEWQAWKGTWEPIEVTDDTVALVRRGRINLKGSEDFKLATVGEITGSALTDDSKLFWIRAVVRTPGYEIPPRLESISLNSVTATQVRTVLYEYLNVEDPPSTEGLSAQMARLRHKPVRPGTLSLEIFEDDQKWHQWQERPDLDASGPADRHYTLNLEEGLIHFGDGINGFVPLFGKREGGNIRAIEYMAGGGDIGNVAVNTISSIVFPEIHGISVENRTPAKGGTQAETLETALHRIRKDLKQAHTAVTSQDFEQLALRTPGLRVARAKVLPLYHPHYPGIRMPGAVTVVVVPCTLPSLQVLPRPSEGFRRTVYRFLEARRMIATRLRVIGPTFIGINVKAQVKITPKLSAEATLQKIKDVLKEFLDPVKGGPAFKGKDGSESKGWPFGRTVFKSEIYQVIHEVEGVQCVERLSLTSEGGHSLTSGDISIPAVGLVYSKDNDIQPVVA